MTSSRIACLGDLEKKRGLAKSYGHEPVRPKQENGQLYFPPTTLHQTDKKATVMNVSEQNRSRQTVSSISPRPHSTKKSSESLGMMARILFHGHVWVGPSQKSMCGTCTRSSRSKAGLVIAVPHAVVIIRTHARRNTTNISVIAARFEVLGDIEHLFEFCAGSGVVTDFIVVVACEGVCASFRLALVLARQLGAGSRGRSWRGRSRGRSWGIGAADLPARIGHRVIG